MALSAAIIWEVRPANGTANAGGGFKAGASGTDRSQQNAVFTAFTDLVLATTTTLTSAANPFGATDVGNVLCITGGTGFTVGLYEIVSVSVVTATVDRVAGTGGSTGGTGNLGGARSGFSVGTTTLQASLVAGQKVYVKNEAWNEAVSLTIAGTATNPITIEGYNASRGDLDFVPSQWANRPVNDRASAAGDAFDFASGANNYVVKYLVAKSAGAIGFDNPGDALFIGCRATANGTNGFSTGVLGVACEADLNGGAGISSGSADHRALGFYLHNNTGRGAQTTTSGGLFYSFSVFEANASDGIEVAGSGALTALNCICDGNTGAASDGVSIVNIRILLNNCIFSNNGRYGVNASTSGAASWANYNNYFGNATAARNNFPTGPNDQAVDPGFVDRANGNFAIGTALKALGYPGIFPAGLSTGYLDIGAVQRQEPAGGGGLARIIGG
mgnify:CR=1 FL=1